MYYITNTHLSSDFCKPRSINIKLQCSIIKQIHRPILHSKIVESEVVY